MKNLLVKLTLYFILASLALRLFYLQSHDFEFNSDINAHVNRILPILKGEYYLPHSMLHYLTYGIYRLGTFLHLRWSLLATMLLLETGLFIASVEIIYRILNRYLKTAYPEWILHLLAGALMFVTAIYLPFFNPHFYMGQWSPTIWHNPTTFLIKPIATSCFLGIYLWIQQDRQWNWYSCGALSVLFVFGIWAKPSFAISFYPALFLFLLVFYTRNYRLYLKVLGLLLPSLLLLAVQYLRTYYTPLTSTNDLKDNLVLTFFGVIRLFTPNIFVSLLLAIAFPLCVLIADFKKVKANQILVLAWLNVCIAYLQVSFFAEKLKFSQAAFAFGYNLALYFLFIFSSIHYLNYRKENAPKPFIKNLLLGVLLLHLFSGIAYYFHYLHSKNYL